MDIAERINEIYDELIEIRRYLHMHPELSNEEYNTQKKIMSFLAENKIENIKIANTGVLGIINGNNSRNTSVALRADIDALPIQEMNNTEYKSKTNGVMHACGHDVHTTILLGVSKILNELKDEFAGNVKLMFQPAEETTGGALPMIKDGCLDNPKVDYVLGLHVMPYLETGKIELKHDKLNAASDMIEITFKGKSGHGAYPETTVDAIVIASHAITALQTLTSRNISPLNSCVLSFGTIHGGTQSNVISNEVKITGTLRTLDKATRDFAHKRIKDIVDFESKVFGGSYDLKINNGYEPLINNNEIIDIINETAISSIGKENIVFKKFPSLGVEDFSYFSNRVKGAFYHLGCKKDNLETSLHANNFDVDENCIKTGILMQIKTTLKLLEM